MVQGSKQLRPKSAYPPAIHVPSGTLAGVAAEAALLFDPMRRRAAAIRLARSTRLSPRGARGPASGPDMIERLIGRPCAAFTRPTPITTLKDTASSASAMPSMTTHAKVHLRRRPAWASR